MLSEITRIVTNEASKTAEDVLRLVIIHRRRRNPKILVKWPAKRNRPATLFLVASILGLLVSSENCDAVAGDIEQRCARIAKSEGRLRAISWFWKQVITSIAPLAWAALKRISGLEAIYRRIGR